jgi:hypothetical protein
MINIILTESQIEMIEKQVIKESHSPKFEERIKFDVDYYDLIYKGKKIDWVEKPEFDVTFLIDMEYRRYGIKSISVYGFSGPDSIELEITSEIDDADPETIVLPLRWNDDNFVQTEEGSEMGWIGVDNEAVISLANDANGNLYVDFITFTIKDI